MWWYFKILIRTSWCGLWYSYVLIIPMVVLQSHTYTYIYTTHPHPHQPHLHRDLHPQPTPIHTRETNAHEQKASGPVWGETHFHNQEYSPEFPLFRRPHCNHRKESGSYSEAFQSRRKSTHSTLDCWDLLRHLATGYLQRVVSDLGNPWWSVGTGLNPWDCLVLPLYGKA